MEMNFQSYQQACAGMLEAKDKKQYLKTHADKLIKLFKQRDNDDFFYWKFCHEVYHLTEYCYFNIKVKGIGCKEPKLAKLHDLAKYDKELYHMGEVVYLEKYKDRKCCPGDDGYKLRLEIQHIHEKYYPRFKDRNCYKLYSKYASYVLGMNKDDFTKKEFFDMNDSRQMGYQMHRATRCEGKITPDTDSIIFLYTNYEQAMRKIKKEMAKKKEMLPQRLRGLKF
tara:strand:+ start:479 stop:1150 length:672 start_codon:yes stop_codon:yes gene_type:complete